MTISNSCFQPVVLLAWYYRYLTGGCVGPIGCLYLTLRSIYWY